MTDHLTAAPHPTASTRPSEPRWRHGIPLRVAIALWAAAPAVGIAAGALTDPPPPSQDARRRPQTVTTPVDSRPETTPAPTTTSTTTTAPVSTEPPTTQPPPTTAPPAPRDSAEAECDAARAAADDAHAALDDAHRTLTGLLDSSQAAADADARAERACAD
jgi:hypothetical protein